MITDDDLDARLGRADPAASFSARAQTLDVLLQAAESAEAAERPRVRRRRRRTGLGIAGLVVVGGAFAAPAAASVVQFLAQSEWRCTWGSECGDPEAGWIDTSAADLPEYVASAYPESIPFAPPETRESVIRRVTASLAATEGLTSEVSVQRLFEQVAYCSWVDQWLVSDSAGELGARQTATVVLRDAAGWPAMTATDGGGIMAMQAAFASFAESGDRDGVEAAAEVNGCSRWDGVHREAIIRDLLP